MDFHNSNVLQYMFMDFNDLRSLCKQLSMRCICFIYSYILSVILMPGIIVIDAHGFSRFVWIQMICILGSLSFVFMYIYIYMYLMKFINSMDCYGGP